MKNSDFSNDLYRDHRGDITADSPLYHQHEAGIYGDEERATFGIEMCKPSRIQYRRLSAQPEFAYFIPFLPMAICPDAPDALAEYVQARDRWVKLTVWELDHQLVPKITNSRNINTGIIFGIPIAVAMDFFNFANGLVIQDTKSAALYRILVEPCVIIEPAVSMAQPAEKIMASQVQIYCFNLKTIDHHWYLSRNQRDPKSFMISRREERDEALWTMSLLMKRDQHLI